jgi:hypothetical protein
MLRAVVNGVEAAPTWIVMLSSTTALTPLLFQRET